ncbi:MAG: DUF5671 domain-containing protein [Alphaproteobacteria bacterium]
MSNNSVLIDFIRDAFRAGKNRQETHAALKEAGWQEEELNACWARFHEMNFPVPVPRPTVYASPRLTTLNIFYFVVLYISIYSVMSILFTFLDYHFPDGLGRMAGTYYSTRPIGDSIKGYLAAIIVAAPLVWLTSRALQKISAAIGQSIPVMRLRLLNLTLFIAAITILCNGISFVYYFLSGELSIRFVIKVIALSVLCTGLYYYFRPEMKSNEEKA